MNLRRLHLPIALLLAFGVAAGAHAQNKPPVRLATDRAPTALPVLNHSGKVEAVLLLEPTGETTMRRPLALRRQHPQRRLRPRRR